MCLASSCGIESNANTPSGRHAKAGRALPSADSGMRGFASDFILRRIRAKIPSAAKLSDSVIVMKVLAAVAFLSKDIDACMPTP